MYHSLVRRLWCRWLILNKLLTQKKKKLLPPRYRGQIISFCFFCVSSLFFAGDKPRTTTNSAAKTTRKMKLKRSRRHVVTYACVSLSVKAVRHGLGSIARSAAQGAGGGSASEPSAAARAPPASVRSVASGAVSASAGSTLGEMGRYGEMIGRHREVHGATGRYRPRRAAPPGRRRAA